MVVTSYQFVIIIGYCEIRIVVKKGDLCLCMVWVRTIFITAFFFNHPRGCDIHRIMAPDCQSVQSTLVVILIESMNYSLSREEMVFLPYKGFEEVIESIQKGQIKVFILPIYDHEAS